MKRRGFLGMLALLLPASAVKAQQKQVVYGMDFGEMLNVELAKEIARMNSEPKSIDPPLLLWKDGKLEFHEIIRVDHGKTRIWRR